MLKVIPYGELGRSDLGWLQSRFHFSFAEYYNPERMGFGKLRVVNDDIIKAGYGFDPHPHQNMEIISYIRSGAISHQDNAGNKGVTNAGEIQVMSAGSGIMHSEYNLGAQPLTLYQIWIRPEKLNVTPRWETQKFPVKAVRDQLPLLVSGFAGDQGAALFIYQQARIFGGRLEKGTEISHIIHGQAYLLASYGEIEISTLADENVSLHKGDGLEVTEIKEINIKALQDCELLLIDV
ncbi:pirin family protein [Psychromonas sp.]|uniref:pirin family protein n=1 Tax=Psychromonas sp. TaxID=1884585 RepID=UPI003565E92D